MSVPNIIAAVLLAVAATVAFTSHQFIRNRVIVTGRVTELIASRGNKGGVNYKLVAEFHDSSGSPYTYRSGFTSSNPGYVVGNPIRICYREDMPSDCGVYSFGYRFGVAWMLACVALALALITFGFRHGQGVMDSIYLSKTGMLDLR